MFYTGSHILKEGSAMAQNIYDNPAFFEGYAQLPRSVQGLDGAPEWPALKAMLPDLTGKSVIDLGCGYGWFCRAARELGALTSRALISQKRCSPAQRSLPLTHRFTISAAIWTLSSSTKQPRPGLQLAGAALPAGTGYVIRQGSARAQARRQPGLFDGAPDLHLRHPSGLADRR
jgi:hypothetical protein